MFRLTLYLHLSYLIFNTVFEYSVTLPYIYIYKYNTLSIYIYIECLQVILLYVFPFLLRRSTSRKDRSY